MSIEISSMSVQIWGNVEGILELANSNLVGSRNHTDMCLAATSTLMGK